LSRVSECAALFFFIASLTYCSHGGTNGHAILLQDGVVGPIEHIDSILDMRHALRRPRNGKSNHAAGLGSLSAEGALMWGVSTDLLWAQLERISLILCNCA
jgi:hypothetical protein